MAACIDYMDGVDLMSWNLGHLGGHLGGRGVSLVAEVSIKATYLVQLPNAIRMVGTNFSGADDGI